MQFCLSCHQFFHLVGILVILGQSELHVNLVVFGQCVIYMLHTLHHILLHRLVGIEWRILRQIAHRIAWAPHHIALILLVQSGNNLHERRLTGAIESDNTYLRTIEETKINVFEHLLLCLLDSLAHTDHREDYFFVINCSHNYSCFYICFCLGMFVSFDASKH